MIGGVFIRVEVGGGGDGYWSFWKFFRKKMDGATCLFGT